MSANKKKVNSLYSVPTTATGHYSTRATGSPPHLEGVAKQPWEFNFMFGRPSSKKVNAKSNALGRGAEPKPSSSKITGTASFVYLTLLAR